MEPLDKKSSLAARALESLTKDYVVIGKRRVRSWHAWLAFGLVVGITVGIALVANNSGQFNPSEAANTRKAPVSYGKAPVSYGAKSATTTSSALPPSPAPLPPPPSPNTSACTNSTSSKVWRSSVVYNLR